MRFAYIVGHVTVKNALKWAEYRSRVPSTLEPWKAEMVLRGKLTRILDGSHTHTDTVIIRFPDMEALNQWHASPAYQYLVPLRKEAVDMDFLAFEESMN